jgi:adenylate cyclase
MLDIALFNPRQHRQFQHDRGPVLLARSPAGDAVWMTVDQDRSAEAQALVEILPDDDGIRLQMAGCEKECFCGRSCDLKGDCHLELPVQFSIGDTRFEVALSERRPTAATRRLQVLVTDERKLSAASSSTQGPSPATLSRWFESLGKLQRWASSPQEFFVQAARCAVESIGLDGAIVLRRRDDRWEIVASHLPHPELGIHCDMVALDQLLDTPRTLFHGSDHHQANDNNNYEGVPELLEMLDTLNMSDPGTDTVAVASPSVASDRQVAVVVSPIFNAAHELTGAVYGFRSVRSGNARRSIRYLEAHLIELLSGAVSEGIARLEQEAEVDRRRVLLEQAFTAALSHQPSRMAGERREVTLLFADLRGFSAIANSLGVDKTYELLGEVMDTLTAAVMDHDGLVIDYYGDGLAAMWNAPASQADHPELACRAAMRMLQMLPAVEEKWASQLEHALLLGIGVHTGVAQVGNAGSNRRMKYGPRGASVHLASRVEAATKLLETSLVVTAATAQRLSSRLETYRLCKAQLPGVDKPVDLYAVHPAASGESIRAAMCQYQRALEQFESRDYAAAAEALAEIQSSDISGPVQFLAEQIEQARGEQQRRRKSDQAATTAGPIVNLDVK